MAACPSCKAPIEEGADLCLECGEPLGDSPAAKLARADQASAPPPPPPSASQQRIRAQSPPQRATLPATKAAIRKGDSEPIPIRCPGCGVPTSKARCPGCGGVLRRDD